MARYIPTSSSEQYAICTTTPVGWRHADAAAQTSDSYSDNEEGLFDIHDDGSMWFLVDPSGPTWLKISGGSDGITGSLTDGYVPVASGANTVEDSQIQDDGTDVLFGSGIAITPSDDLIRMDTSDGADNKILNLAGGGDYYNDRGATISLGGNEAAGIPGWVWLEAGEGGDVAAYLGDDAGSNSFTVYTIDGTGSLLSVYSDGQVFIYGDRLWMGGGVEDDIYIKFDGASGDAEVHFDADGGVLDLAGSGADIVKISPNDTRIMEAQSTHVWVGNASGAGSAKLNIIGSDKDYQLGLLYDLGGNSAWWGVDASGDLTKYIENASFQKKEYFKVYQNRDMEFYLSTNDGTTKIEVVNSDDDEVFVVKSDGETTVDGKLTCLSDCDFEQGVIVGYPVGKPTIPPSGLYVAGASNFGASGNHDNTFWGDVVLKNGDSGYAFRGVDEDDSDNGGDATLRGGKSSGGAGGGAYVYGGEDTDGGGSDGNVIIAYDGSSIIGSVGVCTETLVSTSVLTVEGNSYFRQTGSSVQVNVDRTDGKTCALSAGSARSEFRFDESGTFGIRSQPRANLEAQTAGGDVIVEVNGGAPASSLTISSGGDVDLGYNITLLDNKKILLGTGDDCEVYYDGTDMHIVTDAVAASDLNIDCGTNKTLELIEPVYEDLQFPVSDGRVGAANYPDWSTLTTNTKEYEFDVDDYLDLASEELVHGWKEGTTGNFHLHLAIPTANSSGSSQYAQWTVYIAYVNASSIWTETSLTAEIEIPDGSSALEAFYLDLGDVSFSGLTIGTQVKVRLKRIVATGGTEYSDHVFANQVGCHLEINTMGSRQEGTK